MRQHAIVIDVAMLGPEAWDYLGAPVRSSAAQAVVVCTRPDLRRAACARIAPRSRRLGDEAVPPRGGAGTRRGGAAGAQAAAARRGDAPDPSWPASSRSARIMFEAFVGGRIARPHTPRVRAAAAARRSRSGRVIRASGSTSGCGATRWRTATGPWTCSSARCGGSSRRFSPGWRYIHTHFGVGYRFDAHEAGGRVTDAGALCDGSPTRT